MPKLSSVWNVKSWQGFKKNSVFLLFRAKQYCVLHPGRNTYSLWDNLSYNLYLILSKIILSKALNKQKVGEIGRYYQCLVSA